MEENEKTIVENEAKMIDIEKQIDDISYKLVISRCLSCASRDLPLVFFHLVHSRCRACS